MCEYMYSIIYFYICTSPFGFACSCGVYGVSKNIFLILNEKFRGKPEVCCSLMNKNNKINAAI